MKYDGRAKKQPQGYVYIFGNRFHHWYKIGTTQDVWERLRGVQVGCPVEIKRISSAWVENADEVEKQLHQKYSSRRLRGEWFLLQDEEVAELKSYLSVTDKKRTPK